MIQHSGTLKVPKDPKSVPAPSVAESQSGGQS